MFQVSSAKSWSQDVQRKDEDSTDLMLVHVSALWKIFLAKLSCSPRSTPDPSSV